MNAGGVNGDGNSRDNRRGSGDGRSLGEGGEEVGTAGHVFGHGSISGQWRLRATVYISLCVGCLLGFCRVAVSGLGDRHVYLFIYCLFYILFSFFFFVKILFSL